MAFSKKIISIMICAIIMVSLAPIRNINSEATTTKTSTDAINWVKSKKGQALDYDGSYGAQCVDLIYYYYKYLGASVPGGNACDFTSNTKPSDWQRVKGGTPQKGDIIIYAGNGGYGHIAIYESDNSTWHQNFDSKQYVVNVSYNYKNIKAADGSGYWGYIRPDFENGGATDTPKVTIDTTSTKYSILDTNAVLCGYIHNPFGEKVSKCGIKLYDESGNLLKDFSNSISYTVSKVEIWFDINNEVGYKLTQATKYQYVLYGVVGGKTYSTSTQHFTTTGEYGYTLSYFVSIRTPSLKTIDYGDSIILHAELNEALPNNYRIEWTASNSNFDYEVSNSGTECKITPSSSGDTTFTVTVYDDEENAIATDSQEMTSKASFFQKVIAFFKKLFGLTKNYETVFKPIIK